MESITPHPALEQARQLLDTMLGYLGFAVEITVEESHGGATLQLHSANGELLTGNRGERLEAMQYLVNRIIHNRHGDGTPRIRVDCEYFRTMREDQMVERARQEAERAKLSGRPVHLPPMNAYMRRVIHQAFVDDPDVESTSPPGTSRLKSITLRPRQQASE